MNENYGKLVDGEVVYAPSALETDEGMKVNPSEASYLAAGWKRVVDEPPEPQDGCAVEPSSWTETDAAITRTYKQVPMPDEPDAGGEEVGAGGGRDADMSPSTAGRRVFSKLKLVIALKAAGLWILTKTWIEENGLSDHYLAAQELAEDNEMFVRGKSEVMRLSGRTEEQVEAILAECILDK